MPVPEVAATVVAVVVGQGEVVRDEDLLDQVEGVEAEMRSETSNGTATCPGGRNRSDGAPGSMTNRPPVLR